MEPDKTKTDPASSTALYSESESRLAVQRGASKLPSVFEVCGALAIAGATAITIILSYNTTSLLIPVLTLVVFVSLCFPFWWRYPQASIWSRFPIVTIRSVLVSVVVFALVGGSFWEYRFFTMVSGIPRYLIAASDPYLQDDCSESVPAGALIVYLGKSTAYVPVHYQKSNSDSAYAILLTNSQTALSLEKSGAGLYVTANVMNKDGQFVARIERNKLVNNPNNSWYQVRSEESTLAVYDEHDQEVFYARYMNSFAVKVRGVFGFPGKHMLIITDEEMMVPALDQHIPKMCVGSISGGYRF